MTFGSLFAGIGGMDLGLERAGMLGAPHIRHRVAEWIGKRILEAAA